MILRRVTGDIHAVGCSQGFLLDGSCGRYFRFCSYASSLTGRSEDGINGFCIDAPIGDVEMDRVAGPRVTSVTRGPLALQTLKRLLRASSLGSPCCCFVALHHWSAEDRGLDPCSYL